MFSLFPILTRLHCLRQTMKKVRRGHQNSYFLLADYQNPGTYSGFQGFRDLFRKQEINQKCKP